MVAMANIQFNGLIQTGIDELDHGISDLELIVSGGSVSLFATSGANGGLSSFSVQEAVFASANDNVIFNPDWAVGMNGTMLVAEAPDGGFEAIVGQVSENRLASYNVTASGAVQNLDAISGYPGADRVPGVINLLPDGRLAIADDAGGFTLFNWGASGLSNGMFVADNDNTFLGHVSAMAVIETGGSDILLAADASGNGIASYRLSYAGPTLADTSGPEDGVGIMVPTDIETVSIAGKDYAIVASGTQNSGALSVFEVSASGQLKVTDHLLDTQDTRFGNVQDIETVVVGERVFVFAGGGDDGLTAFQLLPGGQLQVTDVMVNQYSDMNTNTAGLDNVLAIEAHAFGDDIRIFVSAENAPGVTDLSLDVGGFGVQEMASSNGDDLAGTAQADVLVGGAGNDNLNGGAGADLIVDGGGSDILTGGAGADIFVFRDDDTDDVVTDFEVGVDMLDLSSLPFLYDPGSLTITSTSVGAEILWRETKIILRAPDLSPLNTDLVRSSVLMAANRTVDLTKFEFPDDAAYDLAGSESDDVIYGGTNGEVIYIGGGNDEVFAGAGNDQITGGAGINSIFLQDGNDVFLDNGASGADDGDLVDGGAGNDLIETGLGADRVLGGEGKDEIRSGGGDDWVTGGWGDDTVWLGGGADEFDETGEGIYSGDDKVYGGSGNDTIKGGDGVDRLWGGGGFDILVGGSGNDFLYGGDGNDSLSGEKGNDTLLGEAGNDTLRGGDGNDYLNGLIGNDVLHGGAGADELRGNSGDDLFYGNEGDDFIGGNVGDDVVHGGGGADTVFGMQGNDEINGGSGDDFLAGYDGDDTLNGDAGADAVFGGFGSDTLSGGDGNDRLVGGPDDDVVRGDAGNDIVNGGKGNDRVEGGAGNDRVIGWDGNDVLYGGAGNDRLRGNGGADELYGEQGRDALFGQDGSDTLLGGADNDWLNGGYGWDTLRGGDGDDVLIGGRGGDELYGDAGRDTFIFRGTSDQNWIKDFDVSQDVVVFEDIARSAVTVTAKGDGVEIKWGESFVKLDAVDPSEFTIDDIQFL